MIGSADSVQGEPALVIASGGGIVAVAADVGVVMLDKWACRVFRAYIYWLNGGSLYLLA